MLSKIYLEMCGLSQEDMDDRAAAPAALPDIHFDVAPPAPEPPAAPQQRGGVEDEMARIRQQRLASQKVAEAFFQNESSFQDTFLLRAALEGERLVMAEMLHLSSTAVATKRWQQQQQQQQQQQLGETLYPVHVIRRHALQGTLAAHAAKTMKEVLPGLFQLPTESMRTKILRVVSRPVAVFVELVETRVKGYPFQVFEIINPSKNPDQEVEELLACRQCMLDPLAKFLRDRYGPSNGLRGAECVQLLHTLADLVAVTTYTVERSHSRNQRRAARAQLPTMHLHDVALGHQGFAGLPLLVPEVPKPVTHRRGRPSKRCREGAPEQQLPDPRPSKRRGGGGAWRCFLSQHCAGKPFSKEHLLECSAAFRSLLPAEKAVYTAIGRQGVLGSVLGNSSPSQKTTTPSHNYCL